MTEPETARLLAVLALAYPTFEVTRERVTLWHDMLMAVPYELAQQAVRQHIAQSKWAPTVAEILDAAREIAFGPQMDPGEVWHQLLSAVRRYGNYRLDEAREALPAVVMQVVDHLGGWRHVCMCENEDVLRAHFLRMWDIATARAKRSDLECLMAKPLPSGAGRPELRSVKQSSLPACCGNERGEAR